MFQLPDELLDTMVCDSCHKCLSVGPVKVYPNRRPRCGRCSEDGDGGAISRYGLIAEQALFKCVNRFDGCRQLLIFAEVADHESTCRNKMYICPICLVTRKVPGFLLVEHFRDNHSDYFLDSALFKVDITSVGPSIKTYLYRKEDNLFLIEYKSTHLDSIRLNIFYFGEKKRAEKMTQKFILHSTDDSTKIETEIKSCIAFTSEETDGFLIKRPATGSKYVIVEFHLSLEKPEIVTNDSGRKRKTISFPRNISLDRKFQKEHPKYTVSSNLNSVLVKSDAEGSSEFFLNCLNCKLIKKDGNSHFFLELIPKKYHYVCYYCKEYFKRESPNIPLKTENQLCSIPFSDKIYYSCVWQRWGCSDSYVLFEGIFHELKCPHQFPQSCPVPHCVYRGKLDDMEKHFADVHPDDRMMFPFFFFYNQCSEYSRRKWYIWAYHDFVSMEVSRNASKHVIRIVPNRRKDPGAPQPKVLLFDMSVDPPKFLKLLTIEKPRQVSFNFHLRIHAFFEE
ncbi:hypothetical protein JTB14_037634 [Gonioctena quinquepunctata]|nr:hypothetical protein JTB14_037634 [Gonioctena quinquepunctata]